MVVGATGLVGVHVVRALCARAEVSRVVVLARRTGDAPCAKVERHVVDFERLEEAPFAGVDDVYACLGTTMKQAGSREAFRKVDHDFTLAVAERARAAGATRLALVSSVGANAGSPSFYLRTKGETERELAALGFSTLVVARPSYLVGERREKRGGEALGIAVSRALAFAMVGGLRRYRSIDASRVAEAMVAAVLEGLPGKRTLEHDELVALSG